jgi:S-layer homology domain
MKSLVRIAYAVAVFSSLAGGATAAQAVGVAPTPSEGVLAADAQAPDSWGTTQLSVLDLNAFAFETFDGAAVAASDSTASRFMVSGNTCFEASVNLPSGAIIDHTELEACDTLGVDVGSTIFRCSNGVCTSSNPVSSSGTGGCARFASAVATTVIQNNATTYFAQVCGGATGVGNSFRAYRIFYRLQVSAAPAVATFPNDVPTTSPLFRFVEAMAASGLTGGCSAGSFCPDAPVTRGQLAVFLSSALGLHFPN